MKKVWYYLILGFLLLSCQPQSRLSYPKINKNTQEKIDMERYNRKIYEETSKEGSPRTLNLIYDFFTFTTLDSIETLRSDNIEYITSKRSVHDPFWIRKYYSKETLSLRVEEFQFHDFIYHTTVYDGNGEAIYEIDHMKYWDFSFGIERLVRKVRREYGIDLSIYNREIGLKTGYYGERVVYEINVMDTTCKSHSTDSCMKRYIVIDGKTGRTLRDLDTVANIGLYGRYFLLQNYLLQKEKSKKKRSDRKKIRNNQP
ncbi:hypothetical protein LJC68_03880 [Bacteroidales bacterium OttesenSCG-928-B11]|nr:hypothetical protein [Bacteroidales bacterium OttesenSCG-928-B11]